MSFITNSQNPIPILHCAPGLLFTSFNVERKFFLHQKSSRGSVASKIYQPMQKSSNQVFLLQKNKKTGEKDNKKNETQKPAGKNCFDFNLIDDIFSTPTLK